jgi:protein-disulfide isomerase-like protein with CxxC motif
MADGEMTLKLDADTQATVAQAAAAAGVAPEVWALKVFQEAVADRARWAETFRRLDEFDRNGGPTYSVDEVFDELRRRVARKRAER